MGVIVEFNGLTGCGKSTLTKEFLRSLENENIYCEATEAGGQWNTNLVRYTHKNFRLKYISFDWLIASVYYGFLMMIVFVFSRTQSRARRIRYLKKSLQLWLSYRIFEKEVGEGEGKNHCMLLIDEGIICSLASLIHTSTYSKRVVKKITHCLLCYKQLLIVNFEVDFEWSYQNIRNRKKGGRFDRMSDDELSDALGSKKELFSYIQSSVQTSGLDCILIKSKGNIHDNAIMLREKVNERINKKN